MNATIAFVTFRGIYEWIRAPIGLLIGKLLENIWPNMYYMVSSTSFAKYSTVYIDDLSIYGPKRKEKFL